MAERRGIEWPRNLVAQVVRMLENLHHPSEPHESALHLGDEPRAYAAEVRNLNRGGICEEIIQPNALDVRGKRFPTSAKEAHAAAP